MKSGLKTLLVVVGGLLLAYVAFTVFSTNDAGQSSDANSSAESDVAGSSSGEEVTFVYCSEGSPEGFDPALYTSGTTFDASSNAIYNRLVEFAPGSTAIIPGLAESWSVSDDGLTYTFNLRKGVKFHSTSFFEPTRDFNADDVLFSLERQRLESHAWYRYTEGASWEYFNGMDMPSLISSVEKTDDYTVKIKLNRKEAPTIANLAMDFASILSAEYAGNLEKSGEMQNLNQAPIGTGPYQFEAYQKDSMIRYSANPSYWRGKEAIDKLVFAITTDGTVRAQKLKTDECQVIPYPNPADVASLQKDPNINVLQQEGLNVGYLAYNTLVKPFDDVRVRKALNMAINKDAIIEAVFEGSGKVAKNPIPPTMWSYDESTQDDAYDPEASKNLLAEAGVVDLEMKIWAMPVMRPYNPNARRMAELIQSDFAKVGVKAEVVSYEWGEYLKLSKDKDRDGAVLLGWTGDNGDPDNFLSVLLSCSGVGGSNRAHWCNESFDEVVNEAKQISDINARTDLYKKAQKIFKEQAPWATIAHSVVFMPMSNRVQGYKIDPLGGHSFSGVSLKE